MSAYEVQGQVIEDDGKDHGCDFVGSFNASAVETYIKVFW
jgi:hypothetical protein